MKSFVCRVHRETVLSLALTGAAGLLMAACSNTPHATVTAPVGRVDWIQEKTTGEVPAARGAGKWVAVGNQLVLFGGFKECFDKSKCDHTYYEDLYVFDVTTNKWEKRAPKGKMPGKRAFLGASAYSKKKTALFFGGTFYRADVATVRPYESEETIRVYDDLWEYDPATDTFTQRKYANAGPGRRLGAEIVVKGDTMYSLGGYDSGFKAHNDLWSYDLNANTWKLLRKDDDPASPSKRYIFRFELSETGDDAYIFGGNYREKLTIQRNDLWKYNFAADKFTEIISEKATNITGRTHGAAAVVGNQFIHAFGDIPDGGCTTDQASEHQNPTDEVWSNQMGIPGAKWRRVSIGSSPPPLKRVFYAMAGDKLYVTHGFNYKCGGGNEGAEYNLNLYSLPLKQVQQAIEP